MRTRAPRTRVTTAKATRATNIVAQLRRIEDDGGNGELQLPDGAALDVTNLHKIWFPGERLTKGDVMRYYASVAKTILPVLADRPLVLKRHPDGITGTPFFQQKAPDDSPHGVRVEEVSTDDGNAARVVGGNLITLLYCVQLGAIEMNPWHSRIGSLDFPDYMILDLDPGPRATFRDVVRVARLLRQQLDELGMTAAVKTSGSRGMHIYLPLAPDTSDESARIAAGLLANRAAKAEPKLATTKRLRAARPAGAVYVDFLQNVVGKSVASAFGVRARPGATVSTPVAWDELTDDLDPRAFTIRNVVPETAARGRRWQQVMQRKNRLERLVDTE